MAKKAKFEIYEGFTKRKKKYIVTDIDLDSKAFDDLLDISKKFFKCSVPHLLYSEGYIWKGKLYLELTADIFGAKPVSVITYNR